MTELDAALTDFAIALECVAFAIAGALRERAGLQNAFTALFASTAVAAVSGGLVHGLFPDPGSSGYRVLWPATLLAIVGSSVALALAACELSGAGRVARRAVWLAALSLAVAIVAGAQSFALAVCAYAPASLGLTYAFARRYQRAPVVWSACGVAGPLLGVTAGGLQQLGFSPAPALISPNAFYHVLQMVALALLFVASRGAALASPQADA